MPIHGKAAVSYGNAWVQSLKQPTPWLWDGLVAEDAITLLSAPEKTGKTTLLSLLLDRRREGGQLLGRGVRPGRTILCSEENVSLWALRQPPLDFGPQLEYHRPIGGNPTPGRWRRFIDHLLELAEGAFDLLVIDTVMSFLPAAGLPAADPQMQFLTGGTTVGFTIPANSNQALFADGSGGVSFQTGTVAGTITFTVTLQSSGENITPSPPPRATATVNAQAPVISSVAINSVSGNVFEVVITGYASIREVTEANFTFGAATGIQVKTPNVKVNLTSVFTQWYQSATSQNFGSQFKLTVPFTLQGGTRSGLSGVTVNLVNRIGTSNNFTQPF